MERSHLFIAGIFVVFLVVVVIVFGAITFSTGNPNERNSSKTSDYATFSAPTNVFESLRHDETNRRTNILASSTPRTPQEQQLALQNIIREWEYRAGSSDARAARASSLQGEPKTPEQIESQELSNLFNDLIGTKLTDSFAQQSSQNSSNNDSVWLGGYSNSQGAVTKTTSQSKTQLELKTYGNKLASVLKTFDLSQGDQTDVLNTFIKNRDDTKSLKRLTDGYIELSAEISNIQEPALLSSTHQGLISSYKSVGELLWNLTLATNDKELMERMLTYNKSSEAVAKHQVSLITLLKAHGVTFESYEPGSIFTFSPSTQN